MLRNPMHAAYTILGLILHHCPTGKEQAFMSQKYSEIVRQIYLDFETNHDIEGEKAMAGILLDGLKYGNWPWSIPAERSQNPFKVGDRVREGRTAPKKVDSVGTVTEVDGDHIKVVWDKENCAPTYGLATRFVLVPDQRAGE